MKLHGGDGRDELEDVGSNGRKEEEDAQPRGGSEGDELEHDARVGNGCRDAARRGATQAPEKVRFRLNAF